MLSIVVRSVQFMILNNYTLWFYLNSSPHTLWLKSLYQAMHIRFPTQPPKKIINAIDTWGQKQTHRERNSSNINKSYLAILFWRKWSKIERKVHLTASVCSRWLNRTQINPNKSKLRPGLINDSHSFNRSRCVVQIVAEVEGTVVLESRTAISFFFESFWISSETPPLLWLDDLMPLGAQGCYGENARTCLTPAGPWALYFNTSVAKVMCSHGYKYCSRHIRGSVRTILTAGCCRDSLSRFVPTLSSGLLFDIVAARAVALLVRGALWEGKLVHLGWLLFHAEERLCLGTEKEETWASSSSSIASQEEPPSLSVLMLYVHLRKYNDQLKHGNMRYGMSGVSNVHTFRSTQNCLKTKTRSLTICKISSPGQSVTITHFLLFFNTESILPPSLFYEK